MAIYSAKLDGIRSSRSDFTQNVCGGVKDSCQLTFWGIMDRWRDEIHNRLKSQNP